MPLAGSVIVAVIGAWLTFHAAPNIYSPPITSPTAFTESFSENSSKLDRFASNKPMTGLSWVAQTCSNNHILLLEIVP